MSRNRQKGLSAKSELFKHGIGPPKKEISLRLGHQSLATGFELVQEDLLH